MSNLFTQTLQINKFKFVHLSMDISLVKIYIYGAIFIKHYIAKLDLRIFGRFRRS